MTAHPSQSQRSERVSPVPVTSAPTAPRRSASDQSGDRIIGVFAPELLHRPYLDPRMIEKVNGGYAQRDLDTPVHVSIGEPGWFTKHVAMPLFHAARAATPSGLSRLRRLRASMASTIAVALVVLTALYFAWQFAGRPGL
jgi:hypothetical protein